MKRVLILLGLFFITSHQQSLAAKESATQTEMDLYITVQEALASDSLQAAQKAAAKLVKNTKSSDVKNSASAISNAKSLNAARESFKVLSNFFVKIASDQNSKDLEVYTCPMTNADWVQKTGDTANPYYGKQMANCGEKKVKAEIKK